MVEVEGLMMGMRSKMEMMTDGGREGGAERGEDEICQRDTNRDGDHR